jgi:hypothetical protein
MAVQEFVMTIAAVRRGCAVLLLLCVGAVSVVSGQSKAVDVSGAWAFEVQTDAGAGSPTITFKQEGEALTGHYTGTFGEADLTGTVKGSEIQFSFSSEVQGFSLTSTYKGTIEGDTAMKGTVEIAQLGGGSFTAKKK